MRWAPPCAAPRPAMAIEVEAKFLADGPAPLSRLAAAGHLGRAALGPASTFDETDRYLDTDDGRLEAAGWACRLRQRGASVRISLKGPPDAASGGFLHQRPEVEAPATESLDPSAWPASEAREMVERLSDGRPLRERFRLVQRRTERGVDLDGSSVGTLSLDEVAVRHDGHSAGTLFAVELELALGSEVHSAATDALSELGRELEAQHGLEPDTRTKVQHALALIGAA
jgi:inorganic triphosphatase YgiF